MFCTFVVDKSISQALPYRQFPKFDKNLSILKLIQFQRAVCALAAQQDACNKNACYMYVSITMGVLTMAARATG